MEENVFYCEDKSIKECVIPDGYTKIGYRAFSGCFKLTSISIPNSVTSIGASAFSNCSGLTSITIPNSVTSIGNSAFQGCSGLTSVTIGNSVTSIGNYAFWGCSGLTSVSIPNSVTSIWRHAFDGCYSLTSITIPNSVTNIGSYAFSGCSGLTSVTIPSSITSIGLEAFAGCSRLTSVHISDLAAWCRIYFPTTTSNPLCYAHQLYLNDELVTNLIIPNSVTSIGDYTFFGCTDLTSITVPNSVTSIGKGVFAACTGLTCVVIGDSVTSIGLMAFQSCSKGITMPYAKRGYKAFNTCDGVLKCRDFEYEVGKSYHEDNIECCEHGFHFCTDILDVFNYYYGEYGKDFVICEVEWSGELDGQKIIIDSKFCTSDLKVIRQLSREEVIDTINESFKNYKHS